MSKSQFIVDTDGHCLYAEQNGNLARGRTTSNQDTLYVDDQNHQVKDDCVYDADGVHYFNGTNGAEVKNDYAYHNGKLYYFDENGRMVTGLQTINGELRYFGADGSQLKGGQATNQETHQTYVFDATNGSSQLVTI